MTKSRLEAFSDGVIAIILTIMVLELKVPHAAEGTAHAADLAALRPVVPAFLSYVLSFVFIGIYWNNHHHMLHAARQVSGRVLWANLHLLFWLSLVPFTTAWMGDHLTEPVPVALYGGVLLMAGCAYSLLSRALISTDGPDSVLGRAIGRDRKGMISLLLYSAAVPLAFVSTWAAVALYVAVAVMWFVPDRRIETTLRDGGT